MITFFKLKELFLNVAYWVTMPNQSLNLITSYFCEIFRDDDRNKPSSKNISTQQHCCRLRKCLEDSFSLQKKISWTSGTNDKVVFIQVNGLPSGYKGTWKFLKAILLSMHGPAYSSHLKILEELK